MDAVNPISQEQFEWAVYVNKVEGGKAIGVKILSSRGIEDIREFSVVDDALPLSAIQSPIDDIAAKRGQEAQRLREKEKAELTARMDQERGFPEGKYILSVTYPHRKDGEKTIPVHDIDVETVDTREDAFKEARSWIQMFGLHNWNLDFPPHPAKSVEIRAVLKKEGVEVPFRCAIDANGHIVHEKK